mmetsp:Transcript_33995/g.90573  ORF Transcript_33995/g.90573 Transcript_33995/m.90573 type:complete len:96 (-) Transcript_33995:274-561(-)
MAEHKPLSILRRKRNRGQLCDGVELGIVQVNVVELQEELQEAQWEGLQRLARKPNCRKHSGLSNSSGRNYPCFRDCGGISQVCDGHGETAWYQIF